MQHNAIEKEASIKVAVCNGDYNVNYFLDKDIRYKMCFLIELFFLVEIFFLFDFYMKRPLGIVNDEGITFIKEKAFMI